MNNKSMNNCNAALVALIVIFLSASCAKKPEQSFVSFCGGTATILTVDGQTRSAEAGDRIDDGDIIETGENSFLVIQTGDGIVIRVESGTMIEVASLSDVKNRQIDLERGKLISSVVKLKRGHNYKVKTPTVLAAVRGTEFIAGYTGGKSVIAVGSGGVMVARESSGEEVLVEKGKTAVVGLNEDEAVELRDISGTEELEISRMQVTPVIENIESADKALLEKKQIEMHEAIDEINIEIEKQPMSLEQIRADYGRIDVITLYNGRVIRGAILSRGEAVRVRTSTGVISVQSREIRTTGVM